MAKWQPIETAPKDGTRVILYIPPYGAGSGHYDRWNNRWQSHFTINKEVTPSNWMPLPEPPESEND